ncbi:MAG TPA: amidohydrolase family protein [Ignavibacteria bacterium]|nr:amidohydrolase family protein [Ignavibacteria bacterium]
MDRYKLLKNALILSFDSRKTTGYHSVLIKNDRILEVDYNNALSENILREKYPSIEVYDFKNKILLPAFINAFKNSSYNFASIFLKKNVYSNIGSNISVRLLDKFFSSKINEIYLKDLFIVNYAQSLLNGELIIAESSYFINRDFYKQYIDENESIRQNIIYTLYDTYLINHFKTSRNFYLVGLKTEERLNNFTLNYLRKNIRDGESKILLEVFNTVYYTDEAKRNFNRSLIKILNEFSLLAENTIITNPSFLYITDIERIKNSKLNVIFNTSDFFKLAEKNIEFEELIRSNLNICIGTGYIGRDVLSEVKSLANLLFKSGFSYESYMKMIITNPAKMLGLNDTLGSIERNKIANLITFDISDLRVMLNTPELTAEKVCEFIIENLSVEHISDVINKGTFEVHDKLTVKLDLEYTKSNYSKLIEFIYKEGKYNDFKEKYNLRLKVDKVTLNPEESTLSTILNKERISDKSNLHDLDSISDFKVIGSKKGELIDTIGSDKEIYGGLNLDEIHILEIPEIGKGFNFKTPFITKISDSKIKILNDSKEADIEISTQPKISKVPPQSPEEVIFKKEKLKFGFDD